MKEFYEVARGLKNVRWDLKRVPRRNPWEGWVYKAGEYPIGGNPNHVHSPSVPDCHSHSMNEFTTTGEVGPIVQVIICCGMPR